MDVNRRPNERSVRLALLIAMVVLGLMSAPVTRAQTQSPFSGPSCAAPPSADTWPTAGVDSLGNTISTKPVTFSAATLLANDVGVSLSVTGVSNTSYGGATITGAGPYTYVAAPTWTGNDAFSYTLKDGAGRSTIGVVHVNVIADTVAPAVSITAPANNSSVGGVTTVVASASDNVGVVGVKFFDGATQIGAEQIGRASCRERV